MSWSVECHFEGSSHRVCFLIKNGRCEAENFINKVRRGNRVIYASIMAMLERIAQSGPPTNNEQQFKQVRNNLYEIKVQNIRMFCFYHGDDIILICGCKKGTQRRQTTEIERAKIIRDEYLKSLDS